MGMGNAILVQWTGGNTWVEDGGSIATSGRREQTLKLPGITSAAQAQLVAFAVLALRAQPRIRTTAGHLPVTEADEPFTAYEVGDLLTAPGPDDAPVDLRVQSITVNENDDGVLEFTPELGSRIDELEDQIARFLSKFGTAPVTENGGTPGADDPIGGGDPGYDPPEPTEPDPVPPTEPWVDPTLEDPTLTGVTTIGNEDPENPGEPDPDDPGDLNIFATVQVEGPADFNDETTIGDDGRLVVEGDLVVNGDTEQRGPIEQSSITKYSTAWRPPDEDDDRPEVSGGWMADDAQKDNPTLSLLWEAAKSLLGRLSGPKGSATDATYIDKNGDWHFGGGVDLTDATVTGLDTGVASGVIHHVEFMAVGLIETGLSVPWRPFFDITIVFVRYEVGTNNSATSVDVLVNGSGPVGGSLAPGDTLTPAANVDEGAAIQANWTDEGDGDNIDGLVTVWYTKR